MSSLTIEEQFQIRASARTVFDFLTDPEKVVTCLPGAGLDEVETPTRFHGNVKVKVGAVTVGYKGTIDMTEHDADTGKITMVGKGREKGGAGSAKMEMHSTITEADGVTTVNVHADVTLAGKIVRFGRGMIDAVSAQVFKDFVDNVQAELEPAAAAAAEAGGAGAEEAAGATAAAEHAPVVREQKPINGIALLFKVIANAIGGFFRKLFGGSEKSTG